MKQDRASVAASQWRRERPDLDAFPMEVLGRLAETAQVIARNHLNPLFADNGLQPGEFDVLATLRRTGEPYALTPTALYEATMISSGGMTNRLDRLERAELIERRRNPDDRRGSLVCLTNKGRTLIDRLIEKHIVNEQAVLKTLSEEEQLQLNMLLEKLLVGLPSHAI